MHRAFAITLEVLSAFHYLGQVFIFQGRDEGGEDHAVFVQDHSVGEGAAATQSGVVAAYQANVIHRIILGEQHVGIGVVGADKFRGGLVNRVGVNRNYGDGVGIIFRQLVEIGSSLTQGAHQVPQKLITVILPVVVGSRVSPVRPVLSINSSS